MNFRYIRRLSVAVAFVALPSCIAAQIRIGSTELRLGQTRESALGALRQASRVDSSTSSPSSDEWTVMSRSGPPYEIYGAITFRDGRLSFVSRIWTPTDQSSSQSVMQAVVGALADLARSSKDACTIVPTDLNEPEYQNRSVEVRCGLQYVSVSAGRFRESNIVSINEAWHLYPDRR